MLADLQAFASDSYAAAAVEKASQDIGALRRMVRRIQDMKSRYGKQILKHTVVLAMIAATIAAITKALDNQKIADSVARTTGKLRSVAELTALGFALYKMVTGIMDMMTPTDDSYGDPSLRRRLDDISNKNEQLARSLREAEAAVIQQATDKGRDAGQESVDQLRQARSRRQPSERYADAGAVTATAIQEVQKKSGDAGVATLLVRKLSLLVARHGRKVLRQAAVIALAGAALTAMLKALRHPAVSTRVLKTSGELEQVLRITTLGFALYKIVTVLLDFATPNDEQTTREHLDDLAEKNNELNDALHRANTNILLLERDRKYSLPEQRVREYKAARKAATQFRSLKVDPMATAAAEPEVTHAPTGWLSVTIKTKNMPHREPTPETGTSYIDSKHTLDQVMTKRVRPGSARSYIGDVTFRLDVDKNMTTARLLRFGTSIASCFKDLPRQAAVSAVLKAYKSENARIPMHYDMPGAYTAILPTDSEKNAHRIPLVQYGDEQNFEWQHASAALTLLRSQYPDAVTGSDLADIPAYDVNSDVKFLRRIENMDANQRASYAARTAKSPEATQDYLDRTISIMRRLRKDAIGKKVYHLGGFVVKWATIFAVQAIMFKMLVYVSKQQFFAKVGYGTRLMLAGLCAVNSILVLVHTSIPEREETDAVSQVKRTATRTKLLITQAPLRAAA